MSPEIARETERFLVGKLKAAIPDAQILPWTGGGLGTEATEIEPPFVVIGITEAVSQYQSESTWLCNGGAQILTHSSETNSEQHAILTRQVYAALKNLQPEIPSATFAFHGIDISTQRSAEDDDSKAHANVIDFVCGVGG